MAQDNHKDSYEDGMKVRRRVLGDAWVDRSLANRNDFNAEIGRQITSHVWGDIWTRPAIDLKTRRFMTLSIMIALRAWAEFRLHVRSGLATGDLTKDELKEIIMQATAYCGAPAGNHATHEAEEAFKEIAKYDKEEQVGNNRRDRSKKPRVLRHRDPALGVVPGRA